MKRILTINEFKQQIDAELDLEIDSIIEGKKSDQEKLDQLKKQLRDWDEEHETELAKKRKGSSQQKKERLRQRIMKLQKKIKRDLEKLNEHAATATTQNVDVAIGTYQNTKTAFWIGRKVKWLQAMRWLTGTIESIAATGSNPNQWSVTVISDKSDKKLYTKVYLLLNKFNDNKPEEIEAIPDAAIKQQVQQQIQ